ncbi:MAG: DUF3570 domain-containing protein [Pseudomonadota bacterium]|nr:DUF3570 domain-containing protein [Pseudomonadota bacterium]
MATNPSPSLIALSATALALPGITSADAPPTQSTISYKFSNYAEDDLSRSEAPFGDLDRYDIDVHQFQFITPIDSSFSLHIDANYESLTGASPWFTSKGVNGDPIVNLSGASGIRDRRSEFSIGTKYYLFNGSVGGNIGYSEEDDYRSSYFGLTGERHFNNEMTTVSLDFSYSSDAIFPTDAEVFNRVINEDKRSTSAIISVSQIISQVSSFQIALGLTEQSGFLSDPYKLKDIRPDNRTQIALTNSYRHFFINANAAWHVNYRYYHDDFGISSHTFDMRWYQNLRQSIQLVPSVRFYSQSAASFFTNVDNFVKPADEYQSSDHRLSAFGAFSGGLSFVANLGSWTATLTAERYVSNDSYSAYKVSQPSTALVRYNRISVGLDYTF